MSSSATELANPARSEYSNSNKDGEEHRIDVLLESHELAALDLWIAMNPLVDLSRQQAIKAILTRTILKQC